MVTCGSSQSDHFYFCPCGLSAILTLDLEMSCGKSNTRKHIGKLVLGRMKGTRENGRAVNPWFWC